MKYPGLIFLCLYSCFSNAEDLKWRDECVGYYQFQLPDNSDVALYPAEGTFHPRKRTEAIGGELYIKSVVTFGAYRGFSDNDATQAQFSSFDYAKYYYMVSTKSKTPIDIYNFKKMVRENFDSKINYRRDRTSYPKEYFDRMSKYIIKDYENAFGFYKSVAYSLYIFKDDRQYYFSGAAEEEKNDNSQTTDKFLHDNEPEVLSLLHRFRPRQLYEVPSEPGFCLPVGFVANDSGHEPRNMAVTYRMKDHPDVTILFQDASFQYPEMLPQTERGGDIIENYSAKDFIKWMWSTTYLPSGDKKIQWSTIEMDGRKGTGSFMKSTARDGHVDYGYVGFVRGDPQDSTRKPDLQVYVVSYGNMTRGHPRMTPGELKALAEHIVNSVRHR
ncbi:hypothetical protein CHU32_27320 [Superficieibacter electus]|uniref:Tle cognate immunity protein 4 C-terminal domain-containing protein n=2 Tax=Superficieibacter electus TaxID=2022662 RepID=A0A2P5GGQ9_9ENTR|nr:T6SS immunity protein Tli4 family protein [Superficieibacter electus]POP40434.1 hypothetical protein CHU33_27280 [Superficieibacter electus]POP41004.1 hypothetical protein CHU32_27320 [Superficieibacter electus]